MESTHPQLISTPELAPVNGQSTTPFSQQTVVLTKQAYIELKWEANYWRAQHARLVEREAALKAQVEALEATVRDLNQRPVRHQEREIFRFRRGRSAQAGQCPKSGATTGQSGTRPQ